MTYWAFFAGLFAGINLTGWFHLAVMRRVNAADREFRAEQRKRLDDLSERSQRYFDDARREVGLPPRRVS